MGEEYFQAVKDGLSTITDFMMFILHSHATQCVSSIFNEKILLMPVGLIFKEALGAAKRDCCAVLTWKIHYPTTVALILTLADKEKQHIHVSYRPWSE